MTVIAEITEYRFKRSRSGAIRFGCFYEAFGFSLLSMVRLQSK